MKILVTGCAGFIGSHTVARLLRDGHDVMGVDDFDIQYSRSQKERNLMPLLLHPKFKLVEDNLSTMALVKVLKGTEAVVHLAAQVGIRGSWGSSFHRHVTNNVQVTQRLLEESKGSKLKRFVYTSCSSVYGDGSELLSEDMKCGPRSPYGVSKLAAEDLCRLYHQEYRMPTVCLRLFSVYGPGQRPDMAFHRFAQGILHEAALTFYGDGNQIRDFIYVDDAVEIIAASLTSDVAGQVVNVGTGTPTRLIEAVGLLEEISGKTSVKTFLERQKGDPHSAVADTTHLERLFGAKPRTSLRDGLALQWDWMRKFVQTEDDEKAIKANVQPLLPVEDGVLAEAKADDRAVKKAARKALAAEKKKKPAKKSAAAEPPDPAI